MSLTLSVLALILQGAAQIGNGASVGAGTGNTIGGGATGQVYLEPVAGDYDSQPQWIRGTPAPEDVGSVFPRRARETGRDGMATLECTLTVESALRACDVAVESPASFGFGSAARSVSQNLNIRPAMKGGRPVESRVRLRVVFTGPGVPTGSQIAGTSTNGMQGVVQNAPWIAAPSAADVVAAYPAGARAAGVGGRVSLYCTFNDDGTLIPRCQIENEEPADREFGAAALSLVSKFRTPPTVNGQPIGGHGVRIPFTFSTRMLQAGTVVAGQPVLVAIPTADEIVQTYPARARAASLREGSATLSCVVGAGGAATNCGISAETPVGYGFAAAAMSLAPKFKLGLWSEDGLPVMGSRVAIPVGYRDRSVASR